MPLDGIDRKIYELNFKGSQFQSQGEFEIARVHYMAALLIDPNNPVVLGNLAGVLYKLLQHEMGVAVGYKAVRLAPDDYLALNNLAINLVTLGRVDEAKHHLAQALKIRPNDPPIWHTRGTMFVRQNKFAEAEACFSKSLECGYGADGDVYPPTNDKAIAMMAQGRLTEGLELYEIRWECLYKNKVWELGVPEWQGEDLNGKTIIVLAEQGYGDSIQYCRFVKNLVALGAQPRIAVAKCLMRLMKESFPGVPVYDCDDPASELMDCDYLTPMLSMLRWLKINPRNIDSSPYLSADEPLSKPFPGRLKIGLCWASGEHGEVLKLRRRTPPFTSLLPLMTFPGVTIVSLQKDESAKQLYELGAEALMVDPMARVEDFYDTARIISQLDLVVSVDSAVAHVAGGLGKPTIVLGPRPRCWRWWNQPSGEPWYKNMKIYPQDENLSWEPAIRRMLRDVENFVSKGAR